MCVEMFIPLLLATHILGLRAAGLWARHHHGRGVFWQSCGTVISSSSISIIILVLLKAIFSVWVNPFLVNPCVPVSSANPSYCNYQWKPTSDNRVTATGLSSAGVLAGDVEESLESPLWGRSSNQQG